MKNSLATLGIMLAAFTLGTTATYAAGEPATMGKTDKGPAWVNAKGMALYTFGGDAIGKSTCNGACAAEWPPFGVAAGAAASGDWTIVTRDDGSKMWAYDGHPLYAFVGDKTPGQVTGDGDEDFHLAK